MGWDTQAWVCPLAVPRGGYCTTPFSITSALAGEMKTSPRCLCPGPTSLHLAACLGGPSGDHLWLIREEAEQLILHSLLIRLRDLEGNERFWREAGGARGRFWKSRQQGGVGQGCSVVREEGEPKNWWV